MSIVQVPAIVTALCGGEEDYSLVNTNTFAEMDFAYSMVTHSYFSVLYQVQCTLTAPQL